VTFSTDSDPYGTTDLQIRVLIFSVADKIPTKNNLFFKFFAHYILKEHLHHFSQIKSKKKSQNSRNQGFSYFFCLLMEGSIRSVKRTDPGGPKTHVSGSTTMIVTLIQCCGSGSVSQRSGSTSGSFYHQAKIVSKTLIPTVL
jgi:hypothetical protein